MGLAFFNYESANGSFLADDDPCPLPHRRAIAAVLDRVDGRLWRLPVVLECLCPVVPFLEQRQLYNAINFD